MAPGLLISEDDQFAVPINDLETDPGQSTMNINPSHLLQRVSEGNPLDVKSAKGSWLLVSNGEKSWNVFDASCGAAVSCIGHSDARVTKAQYRQMQTVTYAPALAFTTSVAREFAGLLVKSTDDRLTKAVFYSSGSDANEAAKKFAIQYHTQGKSNPQPSRRYFIARDRSYHGTTLGALELSGHQSRREVYEPILPGITHHIEPCYPYRDMRAGEDSLAYRQRLRKTLEGKILELGADKVAAFIIEPVVGAALGCVPAVDGYLQDVREVCDKYGVLLIFDEIMCGMGRTGMLHAWQEENVVPDIMVLGKGIAGGYDDLSAIMIRKEIAESFEKNGLAFNHGHTHQNKPVACAAGIQVHKIIQDENLLDNVKSKGALLQERLKILTEPMSPVGDVRGRGLFIGVEFVKDKQTKAPFPRALNVANRIHMKGLQAEYGIFVYPGSGTMDGTNGDHIIIAPPFNITDDDVDIIIERFGRLLVDFFAEL